MPGAHRHQRERWWWWIRATCYLCNRVLTYNPVPEDLGGGERDRQPIQEDAGQTWLAERWLDHCAHAISNHDRARHPTTHPPPTWEGWVETLASAETWGGTLAAHEGAHGPPEQPRLTLAVRGHIEDMIRDYGWPFNDMTLLQQDDHRPQRGPQDMPLAAKRTRRAELQEPYSRPTTALCCPHAEPPMAVTAPPRRVHPAWTPPYRRHHGPVTFDSRGQPKVVTVGPHRALALALAATAPGPPATPSSP